MKIPKILFKTMTLEENVEIVKWTYFEGDGLLSIHDFTIQYFPELASIDAKQPKNEIYKIIEDIVKKEYIKNKLRIEEEIKRYNNLWEKYNDIYIKTLSEYLDVEWPINLKVMECKVGLIPVFPRYLDSFSFSISTNLEDWKLLETCAHETLHFLWFEKWKKVHPETPRRQYDFPYLIWQYSEMVTDPILNNKPFGDIFDFEERGYDSFYNMYDKDTLVMDNLRRIYSEDIPINEKIDKGFDYIKSILEIKE